MRIEAYFQQIQAVFDANPLIQSASVMYDKRSTHTGFIRGELYFVDGSILHVREYVDVETKIDRLMYVYHYMSATPTLIFRYDNTGHHQKLNLPTFPHHKHEHSEDNILPASAPDLIAVLSEIEQLIQLP